MTYVWCIHTSIAAAAAATAAAVAHGALGY